MENFIKTECCVCGIIFAFSSFYDGNLRKTKQLFYCPNGHSQSYVKSSVDILQEKLNAKETLISDLNSEVIKLKKELNNKNKSKKKKK